jgi:DNA-binding NtrC family response regulator
MDKERTCYLLRPRRHAWSRLLAEEADRLMVGRTDKVFHTLLQVFEATLIERALATAGGCHARAAGLLGIGRTTIGRKINTRKSSEAEADRLPVGEGGGT